MDINAAQTDMRNAYANGAPGVAASALVWLAAAGVMNSQGVGAAFTVLFFGGIGIYPLSLLIARLILRCPPMQADNPLGRLALEGTAMLFVGLGLAWLILGPMPNLSFPAVALAIGARYLSFATLYDERLYWGLGLAIIMAAAASIVGVMPADRIAVTVGLIEAAAAALLLWRWRRRRA